MHIYHCRGSNKKPHFHYSPLFSHLIITSFFQHSVGQPPVLQINYFSLSITYCTFAVMWGLSWPIGIYGLIPGIRPWRERESISGHFHPGTEKKVLPWLSPWQQQNPIIPAAYLKTRYPPPLPRSLGYHHITLVLCNEILALIYNHASSN